ncbi:MAG: hypothetical protein U0798_04700 [Gemmataceae bacterium]
MVDLTWHKLATMPPSFMIMNPNTLGLFEKNIHGHRHVARFIQRPRLSDGANMNAIM